VIVHRNFSNELTWKKQIKNFHIIVWSTSIIIIIIIAAFNQEGRGYSDNNTGGWCWIKGNNTVSQFYWEVLGGKFIEWVSCLVVIPYCYIHAILILRKLDKSDRESNFLIRNATKNSWPTSSQSMANLDDNSSIQSYSTNPSLYSLNDSSGIYLSI
jgi:hypothetical protein